MFIRQMNIAQYHPMFPFFLLLFLSFSLPSKQLLENTTWVVNEIHYAPADNALEFIELLNTGPSPLDLCGYSFSDNRDQIVRICEGQHLIQPDSFAVLARNSEALILAFPSLSFPAAPVFMPPTWPPLNNSGDAVRVYNEFGDLIEEVSYTPAWGGQGAALERIDPAGPAHLPSNWATSTAPEKATPGTQNSRYAPDRIPPSVLFAERTTPNLITLVWDEPLDASRLTPNLFRIGAQPALNIAIVQPATLLLTFADTLHSISIDIGSISDLTGNASSPLTHPLSLIPEPGDLIINEVLFEPNADPFDHLPDQPEYVEVKSLSANPLSLRSLVLTGQVDETGDADTLRAKSSYPVLLPGKFAVFYAKFSAGTGPEHPDVLQNAFPEIDTQTIFLPVEQSSLRLDNREDLIRLMIGSESILDELAYQTSWHHPNLASTRGIALERRTTREVFPAASNWNSSLAPAGGTPGLINSLALPATTPPTSSSIRTEPDLFSPDGDGIEDILLIYPPFHPMARFIRITVFDSKGREVRRLTPGSLAGPQEVFLWDGKDNTGAFLPAGIYIIFLEDLQTDAGRMQSHKKAVVLARPLR